MKPDYSNFTYKGIKLDPYRIFDVYGITHPAHQHSLKKLLRAGRSHKSLGQDIQEAIDTLERWKEMIQEDSSDGYKEVFTDELYKDWVCKRCAKTHPWNECTCGCIVPEIPDRCPKCRVAFNLHASGCENNQKTK